MSKWEFKKDGVFWNKTDSDLSREFSRCHPHRDQTWGYEIYYRDKSGKIQGSIHGLSVEEGKYLKSIHERHSEGE